MTETAPPSSPANSPGKQPSGKKSLENPLWDFSLDFYAQPQVADFLLECQDRKGADVCLLLWASYISACGRQLSEESWRVADRGLAPRRRMINSMRRMRRLLGRLNKKLGIYEWCKRCELRMEQRQLAALWKLGGENWPGDRSALALAGQQYGLLQKDQARWAGLINAYSAGNKANSVYRDSASSMNGAIRGESGGHPEGAAD
ncbi:TIGR02444 family protein [Microbulbifer celer]|uniref:TIGR02444 family protein n=1 Tax=Microbulbifer celer TaxID=435905 RepID=A0ABW3UBM7_9GAMM|nr:TIGR02444 family protein [Microbulbifer celer]UFN57145.1 TIGR02444 family protein [Microbulbifer celer]